MSDFHESGIGSFSEELQALIDYGHDCCARIDDRIYECCQRIREAHDVEVGSYQIALTWKKEQDANAMDAGGSVSAGCSGDDAAAAGRVGNCAGNRLAEEVTPITTELREWWVRKFPVMDKELHEDFNAIADRIDAEHQRQLDVLYRDMSDAEWVRLPKDADGVPIHVGERVQLVGNDPSTVSHMSLADDGWRVYVKYDGGIGTGSGEPKYIRHHHADSWERIIEDARTCTGSCGTYTSVPSMRWTNEAAALVARCKALAGDAE